MTIERKPPAINPNAIVFNPKSNAKDASQVARVQRKATRNSTLSEREGLAAEAIAAAEEREATRTSSDDDTEQTIGRLADGTSDKPPRVEAPSTARRATPQGHKSAGASLGEGRGSRGPQRAAEEIVRPPLHVNETLDEAPLEDASGDEDAENAHLYGEDIEDDDLEVNDEWSDPLGDEEVEFVREPSGPRHVLGNDVPEFLPDLLPDLESPVPSTMILPDRMDSARDRLRATPVDMGSKFFGGGDEFTSFALGDHIRIHNPLTGESVEMAVVAVDWDDECGDIHIVYAPVTSDDSD
jgi:hypothetical protein